MQVLIYNFVQPHDPVTKQGGGIAVYQRNLIAALTERGYNVISLSSGDRYTVRNPRPRMKYVNTDGVTRAYILNSPMFAPAHAAFHALDKYDDPGLDAIPAELKKKFGEIHVFHFQNIEGLTSGFFRQLRATYPRARIIFSAHNYNLVCPQVNLWFREHKACEDYRDGRACVNCLLSEDRSQWEFRARRIQSALTSLRLGWYGRRSRAVQFAMRALFYVQRRLDRDPMPRLAPPGAEKTIVIISEAKSAAYARFRQTNVDLCTSVFDRVLAVSERSRQVLIDRGIPASKISVSYIGTAHSEAFARAAKKQSIGSGLHMAYLGYMRADKGFFFFLESLFSIPDDVARTISITIAAPFHGSGIADRLKGVAYRFREMTLHNGYNHGSLDHLLQRVNLGIVPVLWEDNLPQVAIEMVSRGIPIVTSNRGGAQEIAGNPAFTFEADSIRSFCSKIGEIATGRLPLARFWEGPTRIVSMGDHIDDLLNYYRDVPAPREPIEPMAEPLAEIEAAGSAR